MATTTMNGSAPVTENRKNFYWGIAIAAAILLAIVFTMRSLTSDTATAPATATGMSNTAPVPNQNVNESGAVTPKSPSDVPNPPAPQMNQ